MARTLFGRHSGAAARTQNLDDMQARIDAAFAEGRRRTHEAQEKYGDAMHDLKAVDPNWHDWYFSDAMPNVINWSKVDYYVEIIRNRIKEVTHG
jgi:hypothetical protein